MPHQEVSNLQRINSKRMRHAMTDAEAKLWSELRAHRLMGLGFRRQMPIGNFIVDFACPKHKLIIEVDGSQHAAPEAEKSDAMRSLFLEQQGWRIIRFWNDDIIKDINNTCQHIVNYLLEDGVVFE